MKITITIEIEEKNELRERTPYTINELREIAAKDRDQEEEEDEE